jgi:hypothetical protein
MIVGIVIPLSVIAIAAAAVGYLVWRRKKSTSEEEHVPMETRDSQYENLSKLVTKRDLNGIVVQEILGVGNFGNASELFYTQKSS